MQENSKIIKENQELGEQIKLKQQELEAIERKLSDQMNSHLEEFDSETVLSEPKDEIDHVASLRFLIYRLEV